MMGKRELEPASDKHKQTFPQTFELKPEYKDDIEAQMAFEYATNYCLYPDEMEMINRYIQRKNV